MDEETTPLQALLDAGYTGEATQADWLRLMNDNGGHAVFGNEAEMLRIATTETGNIELFINWFNTYKK